MLLGAGIGALSATVAGGIMKPIYAENIVAAIKQGGCIEWYILDKDYCFLDYTKLEEAYRKKGDEA